MNGRRASPGDRAVPGVNRIEVDGMEVEVGAVLRYFMLNKPRGVLTTTADERGRPTVMDFLDDRTTREYRLFPVGRLDMASTGLILLTNDGFLANRLTHPAFQVPREYLVEVAPVPAGRDIAALRRGVVLEDGDTGPARVSVLEKGGETALVRVVIHTGRKRQIRRSFQHLGYRVISLTRVRIGPLGLGSMPPGEVRELEKKEVEALYRCTGMP